MNIGPKIVSGIILGSLSIIALSGGYVYGHSDGNFLNASITRSLQPEKKPDFDTPDDRQSFKEAVEQLNSAVIRHRKDSLLQLKDTFRSWLKDGSLAPYAHYYVAYCNYRLNTNFAEERDNIDQELTDEGLEHINEAREHEPIRAEALALKSSLLGLKIAGPFSAMSNGPKANEAIGRALEIAPNNPRVAMLDAIGAYYKPSFAGGGMQKSIQGLKEATRLFERSGESGDAQAPSQELITWGRAESYAWLAKLYLEEEQWDKAREMLLQAVDIRSDYRWVYEELNPALPDSLKLDETS